jgi:iron(III) transport system ATP-binding protein
MTALLELEAIGKRYDRGPVLKEITLEVAPGEFLVLVGGSGSGKTTLLRSAGGLERIDAGRIRLRGEVVDDPASASFVPAERRRLGMVFQDYALWPHFSCLENVAAALPAQTPDRAQRAQAMLERMHIGTLAERRPARLSGGQQQRVGIAPALVARPELLLLDEPFSSLHPEVRDLLRIEIRTLAHETGTAALLVSHDPADIWRLADRVAVLERGRITQLATPETLFHAPATPHAARFSGAQGGFVARPAIENGEPGLRLGQAFLPVSFDPAIVGRDMRAYFRAQDVQAEPEDTATRGMHTTLAHCIFEAGAWLAYWRVVGLDSLLCSREAVKPAQAARLTVRPGRIYLYPTDMDADAA